MFVERKDTMKRNFQILLDETIEKITTEQKVPQLLLHSCCAPCSSYVLEYLSEYFKITVFYYNPNIYPNEEYQRRMEEQRDFISKLRPKNSISFMEATYNPDTFYELTKGLEKEKEGGKRCYLCYKMRMEEAATIAKTNHFDYFTTTLSISPYKNAEWINEIGEELEKKYHISYLYADFKKKNGYKRSIELSKEYHLYRQDYCGCVFSKTERMSKKVENVLTID